MPEVRETFDKPDSSIIGPVHPWTKSGSTALAVVSNELGGNIGDAVSGHARADVQLDSGDHRASVTVLALATTAIGVTTVNVRVRCPSSGTDFFTSAYSLEMRSDDRYIVSKHINGTKTIMRDATLTVGPLPGVARIEVEGSTIRVFWKGTQLGASLSDTGVTAATSRQMAVVSIFQGSGTCRLDDFRAGILGQLAVSLAGSLTPAGVVPKAARTLYAGSTTPAGALTLARRVSRLLTGTVAPAGQLINRPARRLTGQIRPEGVIVRDIRLVKTGTLTSTGTVARRIRVRLFGRVEPAGEFEPVFLGRVLGRVGAVIMVIRRAAEVRIRFRGR